MSLSLEVDESSTLTPGVAVTTLMPNASKTFFSDNTVSSGQSFNLGIGGNFSTKAQRTDKFDSYYSIARLAKPIREESICNPARPTNDPFRAAGVEPAQSSPLILSDLGIRDWLIGALYSTRGIPSDPGGKDQPDTVTIEIKFIIVTDASATPIWKLLRVSANSDGTFFAVDRTRTHDLIITIGPSDDATKNTHLAQQIGNAVGNANRTSLRAR